VTGTVTGAGTYTLAISATNANSETIAYVTLTVINPPAPVVATSYSSISFFSGSTFTITEGVATSFQMAASNSPTSWAATGLPSGLSINTSTGVISGTVSSTGVTGFSVTATNAAGTSPAAAFYVSVVAAPEGVPVIQIPSGTPGPNAPADGFGLPAFAQFSLFYYQFNATNNPTSWSIIGAPSGIVIDPVLGILTSVATPPGYYTIEVIAANAAGDSTPVAVGLTITAPVPGTAAVAQPVPWMTNGLTVTDLQFNLQSRAVLSTYAPLNFYEGDSLEFGVLLLTPNGVASDADTIWLTGRVKADNAPILDEDVSGPAALTAVSGGQYYAVPVDLESPSPIRQALADMSAPNNGTPEVLTLQCQLAVLRNGTMYRSAPFTITIQQRIADAGMGPLYAD
jgi:hypothetical protein